MSERVQSSLVDSGQQTTWVARLTPPVAAAIATIALQGPRACELIQQLVTISNKRFSLEIGRIHYGLWQTRDRQASEQVVVCRTQPGMVEVHCHGGNAVCQMILRDLVAAGAILCNASEFPWNLFADPIAMEAAEDLQRVQSHRTASMLVDQLNGALARTIEECKALKKAGDHKQANALIQRVLQFHELGLHLVEPWRVVLAGPPNVGKSSLMNAVIGQQRAIVHHHPGTTRDWIESLTAVDGWPVSMTDTAGIREPVDAIEAEGIERAHAQFDSADLVILVVDAAIGWTSAHQDIWNTFSNKRLLIAWNKIDLVRKEPDANRQKSISISASFGLGLGELLSAISNELVPRIPPPQAAIPFRIRHVELLTEMLS
jgi:tRNA modification GTPase